MWRLSFPASTTKTEATKRDEITGCVTHWEANDWTSDATRVEKAITMKSVFEEEEEELQWNMRSNQSMGEPLSFSDEPSSKRWRRSCSSEACLQFGNRSRTKPGFQASSETSTGQEGDFLKKDMDVFKNFVKEKCQNVMEGSAERQNRTPLNNIYTDLYVTEGHCEEVELSHKMKLNHSTAIKWQDIFKTLPGQQKHIRTVLTNGVAGSGKTFLVQKLALDWAEGLGNLDVSLLVLLSFRELNLIKDEQHSLLTLLHVFHPTLQKVTAEQLAVCKPLFIFDGLDESRLSLDFTNMEVVSDVTQKSPVNVLLTNLIKGNLLPEALVWITSRPAASNQIPSICVDRVTEVRGFTDAQKEEYFRRRFSDEELSSRIISYIKTSRSLHIMCQIPVFCWITATVLENRLTINDIEEPPQTLTNIYSHFLMFQTKTKYKYADRQEASPQEQMEADRKDLLKLGRLAFEHLAKGNLFYKEDLEQHDLDVTEVSVYSGVCTEVFKSKHEISQKTVYCFVHLSIQEFLAAVYIFHCHTIKVNETLESFLGKPLDRWRTCDPKLNIFLRKAIEVSTNTTGCLDLFVQFLHGLSLGSNQRLLGGLLGQTEDSPEGILKPVHNLKDMSSFNISPDR